MESNNIKLNKRIPWLLASLTLFAYIAKTFIDPNSPDISWINSLVTVINLSILFSTNGFERIFRNRIFYIFLAFVCAFLILFFVCNIVTPRWADIILNTISFLSIAGTFFQNAKN